MIAAIHAWFIVALMTIRPVGWTPFGYALLWSVLLGFSGAHLAILFRLSKSKVGYSSLAISAVYFASILGTTVASLCVWWILTSQFDVATVLVNQPRHEAGFMGFWVALTSALFAFTVVPLVYLLLRGFAKPRSW